MAHEPRDVRTSAPVRRPFAGPPRGVDERRIGWMMLSAVAGLLGVALVVGTTLIEAPGPDIPPAPAAPIGPSATPGDATSPRGQGTWVTVDEWDEWDDRLVRCRRYYEVRSASHAVECVPMEEDGGLPGE